MWAYPLFFVLLNHQFFESLNSIHLDEKYQGWFRKTIERDIPNLLEVPPWSFIVGDKNIKIQTFQVRNLKQVLANRIILRQMIQGNGTIKASFSLDLKGLQIEGFVHILDSTGHSRQGQMKVSLSGRGHFSAIIEKSSCLAVFKVPAVKLNDPKYNSQELLTQRNESEQLTSELRKEVKKVVDRKLNGESIQLPPEMCQKLFKGHPKKL